jgi:hypothetical protein
MACRRWHLVQCGSLVFATSVVDAPHRIETPARLLFRGIPVRAVRERLSRSEDRPRRFRTPLLGFIDRPSVDTTITASSPAWAVAQTSDRDYHVPIVFRSCRSSRLQRFPTQRADPKTRSFDGPRVCCTPQPTMGFAQFRTPWLDLAAEPTTRRSWTRRSWGVVPCGEDPSKRSPPRQPSTMPSPRLVLSDAGAFTGWRSLSPFEPRPLACRHAALCCSRPQGLLPPRSPLRSCDVAVARPLDAPLGFGSTRFRRCRAHRAAQLSLDVSPGGPNRFGVPPTRTWGEGRVFRPCLAPCDRVRLSPKGRPQSIAVGSGTTRRRHLGRTPQRASKWSASGSAPRGDPPRRSDARRRSVADVIATHLRRDSCATQRSLRRAAAGGSSSFSPSFRGCPRT